LLKFFAFLKPEFAIVHDPANGRLCIGGNLNEVELGILSQPVGLLNGNYTKLFTVMIDYPYLGRSYGLVDAMLRFPGSYALSLQNSTAAARDLHGKPLTQPIPFQGAEVLALTRAHGHSTGFNFPIADYQ
jgi:hypothetical protein